MSLALGPGRIDVHEGNLAAHARHAGQAGRLTKPRHELGAGPQAHAVVVFDQRRLARALAEAGKRRDADARVLGLVLREDAHSAPSRRPDAAGACVGARRAVRLSVSTIVRPPRRMWSEGLALPGPALH